jgi:glutathione synthase/RimK-type ligase-like ATP-grasp enzyme
MKTKKNHIILNKTKKRKKTFYVNTVDSPHIGTFVKDILKKEGYTQSNKFPVDFVFVYKKATYYANRINAKGTEWINNIYGTSFDILTNKLNLYKRFGEQPFFPKTIFIENNIIPRITGNKVKILKPVKGFVATGIKIVSSRKEVKEWLEKNSEFKNWVLQDYILEPDLYNKHKFHIRVNVVMILRKNKQFELFVSNTCFIVTSLKTYTKENLTNKEIHNTHFYKRTDLPIFPKDLPDGWTKKEGEQKMEEIKNIIKYIFTNENNFVPAWKAENAFYLFGADIMFENKQPYLLELNKSTAIDQNNFLLDQFNLIFNKPQSTYDQIL